VPSKHDLLQLCLANKRFFPTAVASLYHDMKCTIASGIDPVLTNMFTIESIGLRYVHNVVLSPGPGAYNQ